jgi:probable HAF family extracellular repeat protein
MKKHLGTPIAALMALLALPGLLAARDRPAKHRRYTLVDIGTLGGAYSQVNIVSVVINEKGTVVGGADTSVIDPVCGCFDFHAYKWHDGVLTDLGTLPGGDNFSFAIEINSHGLIAGISNNGLIDPLSGVPAFVATAWKGGHIFDLGTFGGSFSLPDGINNRGQLVGGAQNTIPDPFNFGDLMGVPNGTQWRASLWENGAIRDLGTLGEGQEAFAASVNESGQVAGISFTNSTPNPTTGFPTIEPFLWEDGKMLSLGSLGGTSAVVNKINNRGQVAGWSNLAGDSDNHPFLWDKGKMTDLGTLGGTFSGANWLNDAGEVIGGSGTANDQAFHGFLWKDGVMTDLGSVAGDGCSNAFSINSKGQVVGQSFGCDQSSTSHAFLWETGGPMVDLNALVSPPSNIKLTEAQFINDRGEIAGVAVLPNEDVHAFLLIPRKKDDDNAADSAIAAGDREDEESIAQSSENPAHGTLAREMKAALHARLAGRYRGLGLKLPSQAN